MKYRLAEIGKSILILLLALLTAVLLLLVIYQGRLENAPFVSALTDFLGLNGTESVYTAAETTTYEAARPDLVVLTTAEGHNTVSGDFDEIDTAFDIMGRYLSDALTAAQTPQIVTQAVWQEALSGQGVYFHYCGEIPLSALADWLRASPEDAELLQAQSGQLLLSISAGTVLLYYVEEGTYRCCETGLDASSLLEQLESWPPDGSIFAFESSVAAISALDGDSVLNLTSAPLLQNVAAANPVETNSSFVNSTALTLGFNPWGDTGYTAGDGSRVFSDGDCRLIISADGVVTFTQQNLSEVRFTAASTETAALIEAARSLLLSLMSSDLGNAELYLTGFTTDGDTATAEFEYFVDGLAVQLTAGTAATVTFSGNALTSLTLRARTFTLLESTVSLLPAAQAAALVEAGSYLTVQYADSGGDLLTCGWTAG